MREKKNNNETNKPEKDDAKPVGFLSFEESKERLVVENRVAELHSAGIGVLSL
jgi:hypothetical protein